MGACRTARQLGLVGYRLLVDTAVSNCNKAARDSDLRCFRFATGLAGMRKSDSHRAAGNAETWIESHLYVFASVVRPYDLLWFVWLDDCSANIICVGAEPHGT